MDELEWVELQGRKVLQVTFSTSDEAEAEQTLSRLRRVIEHEPRGSVLLLADVREAKFFAAVALEWQSLQDPLADTCTKIAVVGAGGLIMTAVHIFLSVGRATGSQIAQRVRLFDDHPQANLWLLDKADGGRGRSRGGQELAQVDPLDC